MRKLTLNISVFDIPSPKEVDNYLCRTGWSLEKTEYNGAWKRYWKIVDGEDLTIEVSQLENTIDYTKRIKEVISDLSFIEGEDEYDICYKILGYVRS